uniref:Tenascin N n=1 Tax=Esox lucius TaxID=8010 RepID=A0A3P8ZXV7_ESOLU
MANRLHWLTRTLCLMCTVTTTMTEDSAAPVEKGVTFSHVYKIDLAKSPDCKLALQGLPTQQDQNSGPQELQGVTTLEGDNDIVFRHQINLNTPKCDCEESESFQSLVYRLNGLEEEVEHLKSQCSQGCCGKGGVDTSCSGHGTYQHDTCRCQCNPGWEGPDCSISTCPDECNDQGRCVDGKCVCYSGYTGSDCGQQSCPGDCSDKGRCVDGKCVCFSHFTGEDCSEQKCNPECVHGTCVNGMCVCDEGFFGDDCSAVVGPTGLRLVSSTDISLLVEWEAVRAAEYYVLKWHPEDTEADLEQITVPNTDTSYLITGLSPGVTYIVQVYAVIKEINSKADRIEATTDVSGIDGIRVLGQTEDSIQVDWQNPTAPLDHFRLTHAGPDGQEEEQNVAMSAEARTIYTITGLFPGTEYLIRVQGIRGNIEGKASSVTGVTDLDAPSNLLTKEVTEDTATVEWQKVQGEIDRYVISYSSADGSSGEIPVGADSSSYRLTGLKPGVSYTVYIWAVKGSRVSRKSSTEAETELDAPTNLLTREVTEDTADVSWVRPQADIDGYPVNTLPLCSEQTVEQKLQAGESRYAVSGLEMGKSYVVTLVAYRGSKRSRLIEITFKTVGVLYPFPMDCSQIMKNGNRASGIYTIYVNNDRTKPMEVFCDMDTDGGGWLVLQRRNNGQMDFMKRWRPYLSGFGNMTDEFWLGLENIYQLTNTPTQYELRVDLGLGSEKAYAVYDNFRIAPVKQKFKLTIGNYRGTAGDAMTYHQGRPFSTIDNDNDIALGNCALTHRGAWWYKNCHLANLNGKFGDNRHSMGVNWEPWKGHLMSLDFTEMKIRPVGPARKRRSLSRRTAPRK